MFISNTQVRSEGEGEGEGGRCLFYGDCQLVILFGVPGNGNTSSAYAPRNASNRWLSAAGFDAVLMPNFKGFELREV